MTPYQKEILERAIKKADNPQLLTTWGGDAVIKVLLEAIEERDELLDGFYHFFGPARQEASRIAQVLEKP